MNAVVDLAYAAILLLAVSGAGRLVLRRAHVACEGWVEKVSFSAALGLGGLALVVFALGACHLLYAPAIYALLLLWLIVGMRATTGVAAGARALRASMRGFSPLEVVLVAAACAGMALGLVRALAPPHGATDPLAYQLALPRLYLLKHALTFERTITGALYPSNMGMLYGAALALRDGSLAQVLHWATGALTCLAIWGLAAACYGRRTAPWALAIFAFVPIVVIFGPMAYIDVGLCFFQTMALWALVNWWRRPDRQWLVIAGVLCGLAAGVKHQGLVTGFIGVPLVLAEGLSRRRPWTATLGHAATYALVAFAVVSPWYVRSYAWSGNPVWPLANGAFDGLPFRQAPSVALGGGSSPAASFLGGLLPSVDWFRLYWRAMSPWQWTFRPPGAQHDVGVYFIALLPGVLLLVRERRTLLLAAFCLGYYALLVRFLHMNPRYGLVLLAALSLLCGHVAARLYASRCVVVRWALTAAFLVTLAMNLLLALALTRPLFGVVLGQETRAGFLRRAEPSYRAFDYINRSLPATARVLLQGMVRGYYCERDYLWGDHPHSGVLDYGTMRGVDDMLAAMRRLGVTHIVRIINMPAARLEMYPDYFREPLHEEFRRRFLRPLYWDESFVVFEVRYSGDLSP